MDTTPVPECRPSGACGLACHVVVLRSSHAPRVRLLAALDQAWTALRHEPHRDVQGPLIWVVGAVERGDQEEAVVVAARRVATRDLCCPPAAGYLR